MIMKYLFAATTLLTLTACSGNQIITDVKVDSYEEEYQQDVVETPVMTEVEEVTITETTNDKESDNSQAATDAKETEVAPVTEPAPAEDITPFTGYTIQVVAFDDVAKLDKYVASMPTNHPVWKHSKEVNGKVWYAALVGQFDTFEQAQVGAAEVSAQMGISSPFIRNIALIKESDFPVVEQIK